MMTAPRTPKEARARGLLWYFTGKPCAQGHVAKRTASNRECRACVDARDRAKRAEHPAPFRLREKARRERSPETFRARSREQHRKHKSARNEKGRARYRADPDAYKARAIAWIRAHPDYRAARCARQRAARRRATPRWLTPEQRREILEFYREARRRPGHWEVDHIVPLGGASVCGLHVPWNLQLLPRAENRRKGNRHGDEAHRRRGRDGAEGSSEHGG